MTQESARQRENRVRASFWLGLILSIFLVVLNAVYLLLEFDILSYPDSSSPNQGFLSCEDPMMLFWQYLLLLLLIFFLIGLLQGRGKGKVGSATRISTGFALIDAFSTMVLPVFLGDLTLLEFLAGGGAFLFGCIQLLVGVGGGVIGALNGSRLLRRRAGIG